MTGSRNSDEVTPKSKKRRVVNHGDRFKGEIERFGDLLKDSDAAQRNLEEKKLQFERAKIVREEKRREEERDERRQERAEDRKERAEERESRERVEMEKFKLMMSMFKDQTSK